MANENLKNAQRIVRAMRERLGNSSFLYTENLFLIASSETLGWLEHYLNEVEKSGEPA